MALYDRSLRELAGGVRRGDWTARSVTEAYLARIAATEPTVAAYLHVNPDLALSQADAIDALDSSLRQALPLAGVPVAIKDNLTTAQMPTTAGSKILQGFASPYAATVVERLKRSGAVVVGKANLDEFAMGSSTEHSAYHTTRNPWDPNRVPGGSSGGSAAAVAARSATAALGSDTGGSIRQPAAYCGVVGLKPTYGRVSRYGLIAFASSLDQIGPIARSVDDAAEILQQIAGHDPLDATSADVPVPDYLARLHDPLNGLRIGIPKEYFDEGMEPAVRERVEAALEKLGENGATLVPVSLPHTRYAIAAYYLVATAEASSNLSRYDGVRFGLRVPADELGEQYERTRDRGFGFEVKRRILLGTHALSAGYYDAYYLKAQKVRTLIRDDFERAFNEVDLVATPTTPDLAFELGSRSDDPLKMYLTDIYTVTSNLAGLPAISLPVGLARGLPVGMQLIGPAFTEEYLLRAAWMVEQLQERPNWPLGEESE